jgi:hypothetical protein
MEISDLMRGMVGYLCVDYPMINGIQRVPVGTGFFVTVFHDAAETVGTSYLITAKHVWQQHLKEADVAYVRLNDDDPSVGAVFVPLHHDWRFHRDPAVDLAVLPWRPVAGCRGGFNSIGAHVLTPQPQELVNLKAKRFRGTWPPDPGTVLYMIGLLVTHAGNQRNIPIVRVGHLSMVAREPIAGTLGPSWYHLADLQTYPGHSGAPVWVEMGDALYLLGVMVGGFAEPQEIVTTRRESRRIVEEYHALGISLVTPVEILKEILLSSELEAERRVEAARGLAHVVNTDRSD